MIRLALALLAQAPVEVSLEARPAKGRIGETVEVVLRVVHGGLDSIEWPKVEEALPGWRVRDRREGREEKEGRVTESRTLLASPTAAGAFEIPPQVVRFRRGGVEGFQATEAAKVEVASALREGEKDLRPPKGPIEVPRPWWPWAVAAASVLVAALLLYRRFRRREEAAAVTAPPLPPHVLALRRLDELSRRTLADPEAVKAFYYDLSMAVREYIEGRFGLRAPERTTEEFLEEASASSAFSVDHRLLLGDFLARCDLVKYAKHLPARGEAESAIAAARRFLGETRPDRVREPAGAAA